MKKPIHPVIITARRAAALLLAGTMLSPATAATYAFRLAAPGVVAPDVAPVADVAPATVFSLPLSFNGFYENRIPATVPFTISAWVNVTNSGSNGYLLSLSPYYNYGSVAHAGIVVRNGTLSYARSYYFNSFGWSYDEPIQPMPVGAWTHLTAQVDSSHMLKVAVNGQFVYSRQLSSYLRLTDTSEAGNGVGIGDPNAFLMPSTTTGTMQQVQVWRSLVYGGADFTPPTRK